MPGIQSHEELDVYKMAFEAAMRIIQLSKEFPGEEPYSLTDQIWRSSTGKYNDPRAGTQYG